MSLHRKILWEAKKKFCSKLLQKNETFSPETKCIFPAKIVSSIKYMCDYNCVCVFQFHFQVFLQALVVGFIVYIICSLSQSAKYYVKCLCFVLGAMFSASVLPIPSLLVYPVRDPRIGLYVTVTLCLSELS